MCLAVTLTLGAEALNAQESGVVAPRVDFYTGPIINSGRVLGLGGAYVSVAEGADGHLVNPAAFAMRYPYDADEEFTWDWSFTVLDDLGTNKNDLDLSGAEAYDNAQFGQLGFNIRVRRFGIGLQIRYDTFNLRPESSPELPESSTFQYRQEFGALGVAYNFYEGDLVVGLSATTGTAQLKENDEEGLRMVGKGAQLGAVWAPRGKPYRFGASLTTRLKMFLVDAGDEGSQVTEVGQLTVPEVIIAPWKLHLGFSTMLGPRTYNVEPTFGDWTRRGQLKPDRASMPRRYLLLSADLLFLGSAKEAVGVQDFLAQRSDRRSGQSINVSPRLGVESEVLRDVLILRGGSYLEPSRFAGRVGRLHGTLGAEYHIPWKVIWEWRLVFVMDIAENYVNSGLSLGFWH